MKNCGTCKHWEEKGTYTEGLGKCHGIKMRDEVTDWGNEGLVWHKGVLAVVRDGSDYYAVLESFKDFGCVMHEEGTWLKC